MRAAAEQVWCESGDFFRPITLLVCEPSRVLQRRMSHIHKSSEHKWQVPGLVISLGRSQSLMMHLSMYLQIHEL